MERSPGLYVHVPFCQSRCAYCAFHSGTDLTRVPLYLQLLEDELHTRLPQGSAVRTVYIGGGTPSALGTTGLAKLTSLIADWLDLRQCLEYTVEVNPDDVAPALCDLLAPLPNVRVSMGAQSLDNAMLQLLHRRHDARQVTEAIKQLRRAAIDNISVDMILALPPLPHYDPAADLERFVELRVPHLSAYLLSYEPGTPLTARDDLPRASDEQAAEQYDNACQRLRQAGYRHYEISNWAVPGLEALHNSSYWQRLPYIGLGPAAASFDGDNHRAVNSTSWPWQTLTETLTPLECREEELMLGLRTDQGWRNAVRIPEEKWIVADDIISNLLNYL